jgi:hypothetical protein
VIVAKSPEDLRQPPVHQQRGAAGRLDKHTLAICAAQGITPEAYLAYIEAHKGEAGSTAAFCARQIGA